MANIVNFNGVPYDINNAGELQSYLAILSTTIGNQQHTINTQNTALQGLQNAPALNQQQFNQLITTLTPPAQRVAQVRNPVLSTPGNDVYFEDDPPLAGIEDVKSFPEPKPFTGHQSDAEPFMIRLKAYFTAKPKAMRFTRNRILVACGLLTSNRTAAWAALVRKAIATGTNNGYYYDNWQNFHDDFIKRYGLTNAPQYYFRQMTTYRQLQHQDNKSYTDEFERLRAEAGTPKDAAFYYLQMGTLAPYRSRLIMRENPPDNYDDWVAALVKMQQQFDRDREYRQAGGMQYFQRRMQPQYAAPSQQQLPPGVPMDVDALKHKGKQGPPKKSGQVKAKPKPPVKPAYRLPPHPNAASSSSKTKPAYPQKTKRPFYCFICDGEGHYARDCKATISQVDIQHVRQLGMAVEEAFISQNGMGEGEEANVIEEEDGIADEDFDQDGDLISLQEEEQPAPLDEEEYTTGLVDF